MTKAGLDKRPSDVSAMFDQIAERYDLLNDVLSLGQDRLWRRFVAATVAARPGERVLDLAGDAPGAPRSARGLGRASRAPDAVPAPGPVRFAAGDALALPFRDQAFDAVTISFGLRNVVDPDAALAEMLRVTSRPPGLV